MTSDESWLVPKKKEKEEKEKKRRCQLCLLKQFLWSQKFLLARHRLLWQMFFNLHPQNKTSRCTNSIFVAALLWPRPIFFFSLVSFVFIWNCRFKWAGMWLAYLMFCTLSGNVPAPKTEQAAGSIWNAIQTQLQNTFCPLLSLFLFLRWSSYWKQLTMEVWALNIWGEYMKKQNKTKQWEKSNRHKTKVSTTIN